MGDISAKTKVEVKGVNEGDPSTFVEKSATVQYDIPSTLDGLVAKFGNDVVASNAEGAIVISLQAFIRRHIEKPQAELQKLVSEWKPEVRAAVARKSPEEKLQDLVGGMDAEARKALIAKLKAMQ